MTSLLAVDIGNSRITQGIFRNGILVDVWHDPTENVDSAIDNLVDRSGDLRIVISSVVPAAAEKLVAPLIAAGKTTRLISTEDLAFLPGSYDTMGFDRLANSLAAWRLYGSSSTESMSVFVVDLGTATTLTCINADGTFGGGFITLGLGRILKSLSKQASQLPDLELEPDKERHSPLAFDTESSILNGTVSGHVGMIEHWLRLAARSTTGNFTTVATGGWSEAISRHTARIDHVDPNLTLKGIYLIDVEEAVRADRD
jgi:type III pantothenate kinase